MHRRLLLTIPLLLGLAACQTPPATPGSGAATSRNFPVFFEADSAAMGDGAQAVIASALSAAKARPADKVTVRGFAAPDSGTAAFNRSLSEARARNVADALIAGGVASGRIALEPRGAVVYDLMPTESRRVEIQVGG